MATNSNWPRERVARATAIGLLALAVVDVLLVCVTVGSVTRGLLACAHDPGKFWFHLVALPLAMYVLLVRYPLGVYSSVRARKWQRISAWIVGALLAGAGLAFGVSDVQAGVEERPPWPTTVKDPTKRDLLLQKEADLRAQVKEAGLSADSSKAAADAYDAEVERLFPDGRQFMRDSSFRAKWAGMLTLIGILGVCVLLWTIGLYFIAWRLPSEDQMQVIAGSMGILAIWIAARAYSEWYGNFYNLDLRNYPPLVVGVAALFSGAVGLGILHSKRPFLLVMAGVYLISGLIGLMAKVKPEWFGFVGSVIDGLNGPSLTAVYCLSLLVTAASVRAMLASKTGSNGSGSLLPG